MQSEKDYFNIPSSAIDYNGKNKKKLQPDIIIYSDEKTTNTRNKSMIVGLYCRDIAKMIEAGDFFLISSLKAISEDGVQITKKSYLFTKINTSILHHDSNLVKSIINDDFGNLNQYKIIYFDYQFVDLVTSLVESLYKHLKAANESVYGLQIKNTEKDFIMMESFITSYKRSRVNLDPQIVLKIMNILRKYEGVKNNYVVSNGQETYMVDINDFLAEHVYSNY